MRFVLRVITPLGCNALGASEGLWGLWGLARPKAPVGDTHSSRLIWGLLEPRPAALGRHEYRQGGPSPAQPGDGHPSRYYMQHAQPTPLYARLHCVYTRAFFNGIVCVCVCVGGV